MEDYKTARDGLNSLTEGTEEFTKALNDANDKALELIKNNNLKHNSDYIVDKNGAIVINDEALNKISQES
nr:MAG TPA: hypothetical protein [Caudoviricetes sp.]